MNNKTKQIIRTAISIDGSATRDERAAAADLLRGGGRSGRVVQGRLVVPFKDAARQLGYKSAQRVYQLVKQGVLKSARLPGAKRASGVFADSLKAAFG